MASCLNEDLNRHLVRENTQTKVRFKENIASSQNKKYVIHLIISNCIDQKPAMNRNNYYAQVGLIY